MAYEDDIRLLTDSAQLLDRALSALAGVMPEPGMVRVNGGYYRFGDPDERAFALLRCVRLVSGFRAAVLLVQAGYLQETYVLLRTLQEFVHDLCLVVAAFIDEAARPALERKVSEYFSDDMRTPAQMMAGGSKTGSMPRRKVYAAISHSLSPGDPHRARQLTKTIEEVFSGYVHGAYPHIMEMYDGDRRCFSTAGMLNCLDEGLPAIALVMQPAFSGFADFAASLGLRAIADELYDQRERIEKSALYQR